jgi:hypothetical protein
VLPHLQRRGVAVDLAGPLLLRAIADDRMDDDDGRNASLFFGMADRPVDRQNIIAILHFEDVPFGAKEAHLDVLGEGIAGRPIEGRTILIVEKNQFVEA